MAAAVAVLLLMPAPGRFSPVNARGVRDGSQNRPLDDELGRRDEASDGSSPPACHCGPTGPGGFAVSDAWSARGSYDGARNVRDAYPANVPQSIGAPGSPNAAIFQGPARNDFGSINFALSVVPDGATNRDPCPVASLTDARTGAGSITISCAGGYTARLTARDLAGADVVVDEWSFQVRPEDTDEPSNGPNGMACERREYAVDATPMDGSFSCGCPGGVAGANCQYSDAKTCSGAGVAQADGACACDDGAAGADCQRSSEAKRQRSRNSTIARQRRATTIPDLKAYRAQCVRFSRDYCGAGHLNAPGYDCDCREGEKNSLHAGRDEIWCGTEDPPTSGQKNTGPDTDDKKQSGVSIAVIVIVSAVVVIGVIAFLSNSRARRDRNGDLGRNAGTPATVNPVSVGAGRSLSEPASAPARRPDRSVSAPAQSRAVHDTEDAWQDADGLPLRGQTRIGRGNHDSAPPPQRPQRVLRNFTDV